MTNILLALIGIGITFWAVRRHVAPPDFHEVPLTEAWLASQSYDKGGMVHGYEGDWVDSK